MKGRTWTIGVLTCALCLHPGWRAAASDRPTVGVVASDGVLVVWVVDETGIPLPGAEVTIRGPEGVMSRWTDAAGEARFEGLTGAAYDVVARFPGFDEARGSVAVRLGETSNLELSTVASPAAVETIVVGSSSEALTREFLSRLPTGRSYQSAVGLSAGTAGAGGNKHISGGASNENTYRLDGATITDPVTGTFSVSVNYDGRRGKRDATKAPAPPPIAQVMTPQHQPAVVEAPRRPSTIYLSNDDSMSLASPQRLLYALERDLPIPLAHIRPHEVLNWFAFTREEPAPGEVFGLRSSARVAGDHLTLAVTVTGARPERPPLDLTLLVDRSGSMASDGRLELVKRALMQTAERLRGGDRVDLVLFDDRAVTVVYEHRVGVDPAAALRDAIDAIQTDASTNLGAGLDLAYELARSHDGGAGRERRVMVFTDAELNTGILNTREVAQVGAALAESDIHLTGVGVGQDFRDDVLNALTEQGGGSYVFLGSDAVVDRLFAEGFDSLVHTVAEDVSFALTLPRSLAMERFHGEEAGATAEQVDPVQFQAGSSQVFLQELVVTGPLDPAEALSFTLRWRDPITDEPLARTFSTSIGDLLASGSADADKAMALMAWTDVLRHDARTGDCGAALEVWKGRSAVVASDLEIAHVDRLLRRRCHDPAVATTSWAR